MAIFKSKFYPFHTSQKNRVSNVAVKVAVTKNLVAVKGPQVAVVSGGSGSEGLPGSGNPVYTERGCVGKCLEDAGGCCPFCY